MNNVWYDISEVEYPCYELSCDIDFATDCNNFPKSCNPFIACYSKNRSILIQLLYSQYAGMFKDSTDVESWTILKINSEDSIDEESIEGFEVNNIDRFIEVQKDKWSDEKEILSKKNEILDNLEYDFVKSIENINRTNLKCAKMQKHVPTTGIGVYISGIKGRYM